MSGTRGEDLEACGPGQRAKITVSSECREVVCVKKRGSIFREPRCWRFPHAPSSYRRSFWGRRFWCQDTSKTMEERRLSCTLGTRPVNHASPLARRHKKAVDKNRQFSHTDRHVGFWGVWGVQVPRACDTGGLNSFLSHTHDPAHADPGVRKQSREETVSWSVIWRAWFPGTLQQRSLSL